jgi:branched-chain amino acid transport system substrate-binding protein
MGGQVDVKNKNKNKRSIVMLLVVGLICLAVSLVVAACGGGATSTTAAPGSTETTASETTTSGGTETTTTEAGAASDPVVSSLKSYGLFTGTTEAGAADDPYVLGLVADLTGPVSFIGIPQRDGIQVMVDRINAAGGINGHPLKLIIEDGGTDVAKNLAAATKLIQSDKIDVLIGPTFAAEIAAFQALAEKAGIVNVFPGPPDATIRELKQEWTFSIVQGEDPLATVEMSIAKHNGYKAIVGIGENSTLFQKTLDVFATQAQAAGITFTRMTDTFSNIDTDFSSQAQKVKAEAEKIKADAILITTDGGAAAVLIRALNKLGVNLPVIGTHAYGNDATVKLVGDLKTKVEWPDEKAVIYPQLPDSDPQKPILTWMAGEYKKLTGNELNSFAANNYSTISAIAIGLAAGGHDQAKIRAAMEGIKNFVGSDGTIKWGPLSESPYAHENHECDGFAHVTVENGAFKLLGTFAIDGTYQPLP